MIVIRVFFKIKPEAQATFAELVQPDIQTARGLKGCRQFGLFSDPTADNAWLLYEEWDSQADFDAYKQSQHFKANGEKIFPLMDGKPSSTFFSAEVLEAH